MPLATVPNRNGWSFLPPPLREVPAGRRVFTRYLAQPLAPEASSTGRLNTPTGCAGAPSRGQLEHCSCSTPLSERPATRRARLPPASGARGAPKQNGALGRGEPSPLYPHAHELPPFPRRRQRRGLPPRRHRQRTRRRRGRRDQGGLQPDRRQGARPDRGGQRASHLAPQGRQNGFRDPADRRSRLRRRRAAAQPRARRRRCRRRPRGRCDAGSRARPRGCRQARGRKGQGHRLWRDRRQRQRAPSLWRRLRRSAQDHGTPRDDDA